MLEIRQAHLGHDTRVGEDRVASRRRHAVDDRFAAAGHGRHDKPARAHAERVDAPSPHLLHQRVGRGGQILASLRHMVLRRVDQPLRMLDAHAHSESLRLELDAAAVEHLVDVPGRMAGSQHDGRPFDERIAEQHALDTVLPDAQAGRTGPEDELAPACSIVRRIDAMMRGRRSVPICG